jgi:muramoyltetrapeptide carboxypeptidase
MPRPLKPPALTAGDAVRVISPASPVEEEKLRKGCEEIKRLGYVPKTDRDTVLGRDGYFAGPVESRVSALKEALSEPESRAIFCARGGYGSNYLLDGLKKPGVVRPKILLGYSDITSVQVFLWQKSRWVSFYGPMVAAAFDSGAGSPGGYDPVSFKRALTETKQGWTMDLQGDSLFTGKAEGTLLGGCLTLVEATLGTPWELDTRNAIVLLEDRAMKPYQVDRSLMHLRQAGKFERLRGVIFGEFPESDAPAGSASVRQVAERIFRTEGIPVAWGVPVGHTARPMLTFPLGVRARLSTTASPKLEILEPACIARPAVKR